MANNAKTAKRTITNVFLNKKDLKRKAIIFARVSTARQEKEGLSLDEIQIPNAEKYAKSEGLDVVKQFRIGESGGQYKIRK